jgi:hypothetical protein
MPTSISKNVMHVSLPAYYAKYKATYNYTKIKTTQVLCGNQNIKKGTTNMKTKAQIKQENVDNI